MKILKRNSDHLVVSTNQAARLTATAIQTPGAENSQYNTGNATEVTGVTLPPDFVQGAHGYNNGWIMVNQAKYDARQVELAAIAEKRQAERDFKQDSIDVYADSGIQTLLKARPAQIENWIDTNVTNLAQAKTVLIRLAKVVALLVNDRF